MARQMVAAWALLALLVAVSVVGSEAGHKKKPRKPKHKHHWGYNYPQPCGYGSVCKDPVMRTQTGEQFYFHGHKDADFCLVSDYNLHINAHFIGRRTEGFYRDFTWVQAIGVMFGGDRRLTVAADRAAAWDPAVDHVSVAVDSVAVTLGAGAGASWRSEEAGVTVARIAAANTVTVEVDGLLRLTVYAKPVGAEENAKANYGIDLASDCMAHLDVSFEFASLSAQVSGVLGQTYAPSFRMLRKKPGQLMPTMGGVDRFATSGLLSADCRVSKFDGSSAPELPVFADIQPVTCGSASSGSGMVCRR